jgi:F-type H+-transporting ATPase subunit b
MKFLASKIRVLALLATVLWLNAPLTFSQTTAASQNHPSLQNVSTNSGPEQNNSGEDETSQFKHSASVQLLARITGLSLEGAYWLAVAVNFAIVAGLIAWASKKSLPAMFRNRNASIQRALEEARQASADANRRLGGIESRLAHLDGEINQMRAVSEREAAAEEERIKAAAAEDAKHIAESARQEIEAATKAARRELTEHAADLAVSLAAKQIHVDTTTDEALVRRFAQQISNGSARKRS